MPRRSALALAVMIFFGQPAFAADPPPPTPPQTDPRSLAGEGFNKLMQALRLLLDQIPQYEKPEVTERGDIIIRRKREEPAPKSPTESETGPGGSI
ncbi:MAG: hypothetical protein AB7G39_07065 [Alphaproteobacteria bacterium]